MEMLLLYQGIKKTRQKGSHTFYRHMDGWYTTVPHHKGHILSRPLIRNILNEIEISVDEYNEFLKKI